jgi:hypothetical protein
MPDQPSDANGGDDAPSAGHNGHNPHDAEALQRFLNEISREHDKLDTLRASYMAECKGPRNRIKETMKGAKESGVSMVAFRELVEQHLWDRRQAKRLEDFEDDDRDSFEKMNEALGAFGDTPLGEAALARAKRRDQDLTDLTSG